MAETPETPTPSLTPPTDGLAERLDELVLDFDAAAESPNLSSSEQSDASEVATDLRAAAAQLRQLDRIKAIVQSSRCPWLGLGYEEPGCGTCEFCRIRDALEADDGA